MIINQDYKDQLNAMHAYGKFGHRGSKIFKEMHSFLEKYQPSSILDFGCGQGRLVQTMSEVYPHAKVYGYDPGNINYSTMPKPVVDVIVSADVFEHIEPEYLDDTLKMIGKQMSVAGWFRIACYPAKKHLPDGRNAHLIVESPAWWRQKLLANMNVTVVKEEVSVFDKSHKWPDVVGQVYDVTVEVK